MTDEPKYNTMTVHAIRGLEARTVAKWEALGWEVVGESRGTLRTEIMLRKPKPQLSRRTIVIAAGALVAIVGGLVVAGLLGGDADAEPSASASASESPSAEPEPSPSATEEAVPLPAPSAAAEPSVPPAPAVLTVANSPELAALLTGPADGESVAAWAAANRGDVIEFAGAISAFNTHDGYSTRYDILVSYGDYSETQSFGGPNFQLRDVGISDLNFTGEVPESIGLGDEITIRARVGEYEADTTLLLLEPLEVQIR